MSNIHPLLPALTVNRAFMADFVSAPAPCFALGLVEERKHRTGFLALRPAQAIPADVAARGFNFGHCLLGNDEYQVIQFLFDFYGYERYGVLLNPNNPLVRAVLTTMAETGDYFFFTIDADRHGAMTFRGSFDGGSAASLKTILSQICAATTTDAQHERALTAFADIEPAYTMLNWVCRNKPDYLDLDQDRFELKPAA